MISGCVPFFIFIFTTCFFFFADIGVLYFELERGVLCAVGDDVAELLAGLKKLFWNSFLFFFFFFVFEIYFSSENKKNKKYSFLFFLILPLLSFFDIPSLFHKKNKFTNIRISSCWLVCLEMQIPVLHQASDFFWTHTTTHTHTTKRRQEN